MSRITVVGAGAFGTALAVAFAGAGRSVVLMARTREVADRIAADRENRSRLPGVRLPGSVSVTADLTGLATADAVVLAVPAQALSALAAPVAAAAGDRPLVAACKGLDLATLCGPTATLAEAAPGSAVAVLTGPSFAADIAAGLPTALTLACADDGAGSTLQHLLSTPSLRLYRTRDTAGAEIGGAVKNVIAIACGACIGAGFGESARAALMTRGLAEMSRLAVRLGGRPETLAGLSGLGDLVLTATSEKSRNYRYGLALGRGSAFSERATVEGIATAQAAVRLAAHHALDLPVTTAVAGVIAGTQDPADALRSLIDRPLKEE